MKILRMLFILAVAVSAGACAPAISQSLNPEQARTVRTVAVISIGNPIGLLGGDQLKKVNFDFGTPMTRTLETALKQLGYRVIPVAHDRRDTSQFLSDYGSLPVGQADAVLDTRVIHAGYAMSTTPFVHDYSLYIHLQSRLVSLKTKEVIYMEMVNLTGDQLHVGQRVMPAPWQASEPRKYVFRKPNYPASYPGPLVAEKAKAAEGLHAGMEPVARALTAGLKK